MNIKLIRNILRWGISFASYALSIYAIHYIMVRYFNIPSDESVLIIACIFIPMTGILIYILYKGYKTSGGRKEASIDFLVEDISSPKYVKIFFWLISPLIVSILAYIYYFMGSFLIMLFLSIIPTKELSAILAEYIFTIMAIIALIFSIITYYYMWRIYSNNYYKKTNLKKAG